MPRWLALAFSCLLWRLPAAADNDSLGQAQRAESRLTQAAGAGNETVAKDSADIGYGESQGKADGAGTGSAAGRATAARASGLAKFQPTDRTEGSGVPAPAEKGKKSGMMSKGLLFAGAGALGALQGGLTGGWLGALGGAGVALGAAWLLSRGDYGGAFGVTAGGIVGTVLGGPLGALAGAVVGGLLGHFIGKLFSRKAKE